MYCVRIVGTPTDQQPDETLLACLSADFYLYLREVREMPLGRLKEGWTELVGRIVSREP